MTTEEIHIIGAINKLVKEELNKKEPNHSRIQNYNIIAYNLLKHSDEINQEIKDLKKKYRIE